MESPPEVKHISFSNGVVKLRLVRESRQEKYNDAGKSPQRKLAKDNTGRPRETMGDHGRPWETTGY